MQQNCRGPQRTFEIGLRLDGYRLETSNQLIMHKLIELLG